ncbi:hypothetical protein W97_06469 [Coniosporium apollinis CBS 100218]|uniref:Bul1 C-terminal domain-containing protein n=1 Tax=Coniosporium apollinis (strain CBS 100218) TaxID=1168221 RepID=R7YZY6_CONA1|nr:uncharacterized protein W97_06469 [Coniosporium apollinis CBS 100218]EON67216.1 hypothetical protein W97_06469 [Coniosporium apollinis CBS 100218]
MHSPSVSDSVVANMGYKVRNLALSQQPSIDIFLKGTQGVHSAYVTSFSTMDKLEGTVSITAKHDTRFDELEIAFVGVSKTWVDRMTSGTTMNGRTEASHRFLKLIQPIEDSSLPQPRIAEAGRTYSFPFTFVVPQQLVDSACDIVSNDQIKSAHLQVPPSLGDPDLSGFGGVLLDDLSPSMAKISYAIQVKMTRYRETDGKAVTVADKARKVRVKPAFEEQPPLSVDEKDEEYRLRQEKTIRKGLFKGKLGRLVIETAQPKSFSLPASNSNTVTTMAKVLLRFDPAEASAQPPKLGSLSSKLKIGTWFSTKPRKDYPSKKVFMYDARQGLYSETLSLSSRCVESAKWERHTSASTLTRRDSAVSDVSSDGLPEASSNYAGGMFYTAQILVPLTLPTNKNFVPTFHSCLISRVYALKLELSVQAPGMTGPSMSLKVPVQISAEGSARQEEHRRSIEEAARAAIEAEAVFRARSVAPPSDEYLGSSTAMTALPPQYEFVAPGSPIARQTVSAW